MKKIVKCKECYNDFSLEELIYPVRGYPYCEQCFNGQSLHQKKKFIPLHKKDLKFINKSIKSGSKFVNSFMKGLQSESDSILKGLGVG